MFKNFPHEKIKMLPNKGIPELLFIDLSKKELYMY